MEAKKLELNQVSLEAYQKELNDLVAAKEELRKKQVEFEELNEYTSNYIFYLEK